MLSEKGRKQKTRSVYKYKPVALKTKPMIGELPGKFRIWREIIGDPLVEMLALLVQPPEFEPMGRYTLERRGKIDDCHKGHFLWDEERKLMHLCLGGSRMRKILERFLSAN